MVLTLPRPHSAQYRVLLESKRFNVLCCGRRWGKTTIAKDRLVRPALHGHPVAWFAPSYKTLSEVWRDLVQFLTPITSRKNEQERWIELITGGKLDCWSLDDPNAGRGRKYKRVVVDETALVPNLQVAWEQGLRPMLADLVGDAWLISTPRGTANYFYNLWLKGQDPLQADWISWQMPTSSNPHVRQSEIEAMREDMTDIACSQEIYAQFVSWAGAVFRRIDAAANRPIMQRPASMIGVDWGRTGDYTVFTALSQTGEVVGIDRFRGIEYSLQRDRLRAFWERHGKMAWILAEVNSMGGPVVEQLQRDGLPVSGFVTTNASKGAIIQSLALAFERDQIAIPNDPALVGELQAFEGKRTSSGLMKYGAPSNVHDDCVMSLAFAWAGLVAPRQQTAYLDPNTGAMSNAPREYQISPI